MANIEITTADAQTIDGIRNALNAAPLSVYTTLNTNSGKYESTYTTLNTNSGKYESAYTTLNSNSGKYESTYTTVNSNSGKYESTYTTLNTNSANYILDGGNTKGSDISIGTNDAYNLSLETNAVPRLLITSDTLSGNSNKTSFGAGSATGLYSFATGYNTTALGNYSYAEGINNTAAGYASHAQGAGNLASNNYSHAQGENNIASGESSYAGGANTLASGTRSTATGQFTSATKTNSYASGRLAFADHNRSWVWQGTNQDGVSAIFASTRTDQFAIRPTNGFFLSGAMGIGTDSTANALTVVGTISTIGGNSNQWNSSYTTLNTNSGSYESTYTTLNNNSAKYDSTYTTLNTNSAKYESTYTTLNTNSGKYESTYTTLNTNSGKYESTYTTLNTNSGNYENTYNNVSTLSGNGTFNLYARGINLASTVAWTSAVDIPANINQLTGGGPCLTTDVACIIKSKTLNPSNIGTTGVLFSTPPSFGLEDTSGNSHSSALSIGAKPLSGNYSRTSNGVGVGNSNGKFVYNGGAARIVSVTLPVFLTANLSLSVNNITTSLSLTSANTNFSGNDFHVKVDNEIMYVSSGGSTSTMTVARGQLGTTAASHLSGALVTTNVGLSSMLLIDACFTMKRFESF